MSNAGYKRKKPVEVPRPHLARAKARTPQAFQGDDGSVKIRGHAQMKAYAAARMGAG